RSGDSTLRRCLHRGRSRQQDGTAWLIRSADVLEDRALLSSFVVTNAGDGPEAPLANASFEAPALAAGTSVANPSLSDQGGSGWTFTDTAGITTAGTLNMQNPPEGGQAAYLESEDGEDPGTMSQTFTVAAGQDGMQTLTFFAEGQGPANANTFQVL